MDSTQTAAQRLDALLAYIEQVVRLDERAAMRLSEHRLPTGQALVLHQHEFHGLPGVTHDTEDEDGPIWLMVERIARSAPPAPPDDLAEWLEVSPDPDKAPVLRTHLLRTVAESERAGLLASGAVREEDCALSLKENSPSMWDVRLRLEDRPHIEAACNGWVESAWLPWAIAERPVRRTLALYQRLFETAQLAELGGGERPFELVWGVGLARWKTQDADIDLPLIERLVEVAIDEGAGAAIKVRPRSAGASVNLKPYDDLSLPGVSLAHSLARDALSRIESEDGVSPFQTPSFEPMLRACQTQLDPEGVYLPDTAVIAHDQPPPAGGDRLAVTDRWVLFARRRSDNFLLADIERLRASAKKAAAENALPGPAQTLVMGPAAAARDDRWEPLNATLGASGGSHAGAGPEESAPDLFFPKPFNDAQVEIVRRLEKSDGVVVQGPPGTGKTHTISNIICHAMATGRRVLVVSHGEPALAVLRDQLPAGVRDLAISVTATEQAGLRQLESAVRLLQSVVEGLRPAEQARLIQDLEAKVLRLRGRIAAIDHDLEQCAVAQLTPAVGGLMLAELARRVAAAAERFYWFEDRPGGSSADLAPSDEDMERLRAARMTLGARLDHLGCVTPAIEELPSGAAIGRLHEDLLRGQAFADAAARDPSVRARLESPGAVEAAAAAAEALDRLRAIQTLADGKTWLRALADRIARGDSADGVLSVIESFAADARACVRDRQRFLGAPIELPPAFDEAAPGAFPILVRLAKGEKAFGLLSFGERAHKPLIDAIRIQGRAPADATEWATVLDFLAWRETVSALCVRWGALCEEIGAEPASSARDLADLMVHLDPVVGEAPALIGLLDKVLPALTPGGAMARALWAAPERMSELAEALRNASTAAQFTGVRAQAERLAAAFGERSGKIGKVARYALTEALGRTDVPPDDLAALWTKLREQIEDLHNHAGELETVAEVTDALARAGAPSWAHRLQTEHADATGDALIPADWREAWDWASASAHLTQLDDRPRLSALADERLGLETELRQTFESVVRERTFYELGRSMTAGVRSALLMFAAALRRTGKGTGKGAARNRREAQLAMAECYGAIPCWIMPTWRVAEQLPAELGSFDLVIMDEASQSDIRELPALLRGKKILIVGDDKQVSPTAAFIENAKIDRLENNYLREHPYKTLLLPGASLYDLAKVVFPGDLVMLREHFRCVEPIIRFSMAFYPEPLLPLRVPSAHERLDPPLIDIYVPDGRRTGDRQNRREAEVIVEEIRSFVNNPELARVETQDRWRTIGVVSLIGAKQAALVNRLILDELGEDVIRRHRIACGDSATFQGNERDVIFLSMIADSSSKQAQTAMQFEQRFNVAMSRARDRLVLVRSVEEEELKSSDLKARVIRHFRDPMAGAAAPTGDPEALCESAFEREVFRRLVAHGYRVTPQVGASGFRIDLVVEGAAGRRLAVECDGDSYHGPQRWADDMRRQRILERVGWRFWRCWASSFALDPDGCMADLFDTLDRAGIAPNAPERAASTYTLHVRAPERNQAPSEQAKEAGDTAAAAAEAIAIGDKVVIQYLDDQKQTTVTLTKDRDDVMNGFVTVASLLGQKLLGASEDEEIEIDQDSRLRRVLVRKVDRASARSVKPEKIAD